MKRILFVALSLKAGGIEKALVNQINDLANQEQYKVDLVVFSNTGEYVNHIDKKVNVYEPNYVLSCLAKTFIESKKNIFCFLIRCLFLVLVKIFTNKIVYSFLFKCLKKIGVYDVAISYFQDSGSRNLRYGCNLYVLSNVIANKKVTWIHSDYLYQNLNYKSNNEICSQFDYVINVSETMKKKFDSLDIIDEQKSLFIYNRIDIENIKLISLKESYFNSSFFNIVTVGRIEPLKSSMKLCEIAKDLILKGYNIKWYFIGTGVQLNDCQNFANNNKLSDRIVFLGQKEFPYYYMKDADLFVSGSLTETFGLSIVESLVLNVPVVAYYYDAIGEVLNCNNGIVASDFDELKAKIEKMIVDKKFYIHIKDKTRLLSDYNFLNRMQVYKLIEGC